MPRVLITGAAGFIGMHTSIRFLKEGWDVTGLDNFNDYYSVDLKEDRIKNISAVVGKLDLNFDLIRADLNSSIWDNLSKLKFDAVVHLAAQAGVRFSIENPNIYLESNVLGFQRVLHFVKKNRVERFIYASSSSVYGKSSRQPFTEDEACNSPESYYAATKKMNELMAFAYYRTHNLPSVGLRFFTVYGPWGRPDMAPILFTTAAYENKSIQVFNYGNQKRDFTFIDDVIDGIFGLIKTNKFPKNSIVCNIGNGSPIGLLDFIEEIERSTNKQLNKKFIKAQKGDVTETYSDTSKLFELTGYRPKTSLNQGISNIMNNS